MKTISSLLICLGLVLACPAIFSQQEKKPAPEENFYYRALFASLDKMESSWGSEIDGSGTRVGSDYHNMIVEENRDITNGLPTQLGAYRVTYLDDPDLIARYRKLRKEFPMLRVFPMRNDGERLRISFNLYWFSYTKKSLNFSLSVWSHVFFRFDCEKREYVIDEVKLGGI